VAVKPERPNINDDRPRNHGLLSNIDKDEIRIKTSATARTLNLLKENAAAIPQAISSQGSHNPV
jgi:hypothetical protein